ncbi:MAG: hypothetical protein Q4B50_02195 [Bacillota bacterium]|nr:hypothetical protein [Bacillota bacterium]
MKKLSFAKLLCLWFFFALTAHMINGLTLKSSLLASLCTASLGIFLLFCPIYPQRLAYHWDEQKCKAFIRLLAVLNILLSFVIRIRF